MHPLSLLAVPPVAVGLLVYGSALLTVAHALEETFGAGGPLWDYLSSVRGGWPRALRGALAVVVTSFLPASLLLLAWHGYGGSAAALSALAGARLADLLCTHLLPGLACRRWLPNPGLGSAALSAAEGVAILSLSPAVPWALALGILPFAALTPLWWPPAGARSGVAGRCMTVAGKVS